MKTPYIIIASLVFGFSVSASAQSKTDSISTKVCPQETVQPYSIEEESDLGSGEADFHSDKANINLYDEGVEVESPDTETDMAAPKSESHIKSAASSAGSSVKSGASKVGSTAKKGGKTVVKGAKKVGNAVETGAKEGWQEVKEHTPGTDTREMHKKEKLD